MECMQAQDRIDQPNHQDLREARRVSVDLSPLVGTWDNTNSAAQGITKVIIRAEDGQLSVRAFGADHPRPRDWGELKADVTYPAGIRPHECMGFMADYDFAFMQVHLQGNMNLGLLILASFNAFTDQSGRSNYFGREFFRKRTGTH